MKPIKSIFQRIGISLCTGLIFVYFSEWLFWGFKDEGKVLTAGVLIPGVIVYSIFAYAFFWAVSVFRVRTMWALFLAGAIVGWLCEGVFVQTMYDDFPLNISFTGLAWHSLITVMVGWYLVRRVLQENRPAKMMMLCAVIGLVYGLWSICWWYEEGRIASVQSIWINNFYGAGLLAVCYWLYDRFTIQEFKPSRIEAVLFFLLVILFYTFVTIPSQPKALYVLPPAFAYILFFLWLNGRKENRPDLFQSTAGNVRITQCLLLFIIPLTASCVYTVLHYINIPFPTHQVLYTITTPAGFVMLLLSAYKIFRMKISP